MKQHIQFHHLGLYVSLYNTVSSQKVILRLETSKTDYDIPCLFGI